MKQISLALRRCRPSGARASKMLGYNRALRMLPDLSVVIPIRNESANLGELHGQLTQSLSAWGRPYEILLIDDGSTDNSFAIMSELHARDPHVKVIRFRRNFGQTAAFSAGFAHARGRIIVTADG